MDAYFENQIAVVTGAAGRLCSRISVDLARKGARVVLADRSLEALESVAREIEAFGGQYLKEVCDVTSEETVEALAQRVKAQWGNCRFLINGAGGNNNKAVTTTFTFDPRELNGEKPEDMVGFYDLSMDVIKSVLEINTLGTLIPSRVFSKQMAEAGKGAIVNFGSMNSYRPLTRVPAYAMSKAAVVNMTQWLATYLAPAGIRVNAVAPGFFVNERSRKILCTPEGGLSQRGQNVINHTPMGRFGEAEELLGCVSWLLDDRAAGFVTGITVPVDGGFLAHSGI